MFRAGLAAQPNASFMTRITLSRAFIAVVSLSLVSSIHGVCALAQDAASDRIIVKLRGDGAQFAKPHITTADDARALAERVGLMMTHTHALGSDLHMLRIAAPVTAHMLSEIRRDASVEFAEVDRKRF